MKRSALCIAVIFSILFFSCATSPHLPVPGEGAAVKKSLSLEYLSIADAYNELAKYDKAAQYYLLAMKNKKVYWSAYYKLGRCYAMSKNWTEARKVYSSLLKRDPDNVSIRMSLAYIYAMEGNLKSAEAIYELLCKENPDNADILVNYIDVLIASEKYETAELKLSEMKEKFSDNKTISVFEKKLEELNPKDIGLEESDRDAAEITEESEAEMTESLLSE